MDYKTFEVNIAEDAIDAISRVSPQKAIEEIIWNSLDAEAKRVSVLFIDNVLGGTERLVVEDDGHGISPQDATEVFRQIGGSPKKMRRRSPALGRPYHGKEGRGRYKFFALGSRVEWRSRVKVDGVLVTFAIVADHDKLKSIRISETHAANDEKGAGCDVIVSNTTERLTRIRSESYKNSLPFYFAPYLMAHKDAVIVYDGQHMDPAAALDRRKVYELEIVSKKNGAPIQARLEVMEWKRKVSPTLFFCDENGVALEETPTGVRASRFSYTAYLSSDYVREMDDQGLLLVELDQDFVALKAEVRRLLREHFRERATEDAVDVVQRIKQEGLYPYKSPPQDNVERAGQQVFDICAASVHEYLPRFEDSATEARSLTYRLLREALEQNPHNLSAIFSEVLKLTEEQQDDLAELIDKTSLGAIIRTGKMIANRLQFINALEQIVHQKPGRDLLKERSQLHRILVEELWVFGEEYALGSDDRSLRNVLHEHRRVLGVHDIDPELDAGEIDDLRRIPDLMLWRQYSHGRREEYDHLVIELKAPKVKVGFDEVTQATRYATTVGKNRHFDKEKTRWAFWVVSDEIHADLEPELQKTNAPVGQFSSTKYYEVWAMTWAQVLQRAKIRHEFLKDRLDYAVRDDAEGMEYLRQKYAKFLPDELQVPPGK